MRKECIELAVRIEEVCLGYNIIVVETAVLMMMLRTIELIDEREARNDIISGNIMVLSDLIVKN